MGRILMQNTRGKEDAEGASPALQERKGRPMPLDEQWETAWDLVSRRTFRSSLHFAFASVNPDGTPHVTPIGSLILRRDEPTGFYFELFTKQLPRNLDQQPHVCILAVNSSKWFWLRALFFGRFPSPPAVRLRGTVGVRRQATEEEIALFLKRVRWTRWLKGYQRIWGNLRFVFVRDIHFESIEPVRLGPMTQGLWQPARNERKEEHSVV